MKVRIKDLIAFYNDRIQRNSEAIKKREAAYEKSKVDYESKFLPKLFGWKYKDSIDPYLSFCRYSEEERINNYKEQLEQINYFLIIFYGGNRNCNELFDLPEKYSISFFNFAKENITKN